MFQYFYFCNHLLNNFIYIYIYIYAYIRRGFPGILCKGLERDSNMQLCCHTLAHSSRHCLDCDSSLTWETVLTSLLCSKIYYNISIDGLDEDWVCMIRLTYLPLILSSILINLISVHIFIFYNDHISDLYFWEPI